MSSTYDFPSDNGQCENTDREIWRGPDEGNGDYYADSLHITREGALGINCGGSVYVKPIREWHRLAGGPISLSGDVAQASAKPYGWHAAGNGLFTVDDRVAEVWRGHMGLDVTPVYAAQPPAAPVEKGAVEGELDTIVQLIHKHVGIRQRVNVDLTGVEDAAKAILNALRPLSRCSAGNEDHSELRKLQEIIDNQADQILDLHEVLKSAYLLHEFIAGAYTLSLADFRYLNVVSTRIKAALSGDVIPDEPQRAPLRPYRAAPAKFRESYWVVEREYPCINGLSAWFVVADFHQPDEAELGYTEGAIGSAQERAEEVAKALNAALSLSRPLLLRDEGDKE